MSQHFLLSPLARSLRDDEFSAINNDEPTARCLFMLMRWNSLTEQVCPRCGSCRAHMPRPKHNGWRCRDCLHDFSLTSGSLFDNSKLPMWKIIKGVYLFVTNSKGRSAIELSHKLGVGYRAAYLLLHKIRWAFWMTPPEQQLTGEFDLDVVWVLKGIRDYNDRSKEANAKRQQRKQDKLKARLLREGVVAEQAEKVAKKEYPLAARPRRTNPKKQCILAISQRDPAGKGSKLVLGFPLPGETYELVRDIVYRFIAPDSVIYTDQAGAYTELHSRYEVRPVNHDEVYVDTKGWHTNFVESVFSRWRRMEIGTYHRMNPRTLHLYFAECAWRESYRRSSPMQKVTDALSRCVHVRTCREYRKYQDRPHATGAPKPGARTRRSKAASHAVRAPEIEAVRSMATRLGLVQHGSAVAALDVQLRAAADRVPRSRPALNEPVRPRRMQLAPGVHW